MADVQLPDGTILRFPDGMSDAEMAAATKRYWDSQNAPQVRPQARPEREPQSGNDRLNTVSQMMGANQSLRNAQPAPDRPSRSVAGDIAQAGLAGLGRGTTALAGLPGSVDNLITSGLERVGAIPEGQARGNPLSGGNLTGLLSSLTGGASDYRGDSRAARIAGTVGEFAPGVMAMGGAKALPMFAGVSGAGSELAGEAAQGRTVPDWVPGVGGAPLEPAARVAGALAAPMAANSIARAITPNPADPARLQAARNLESQGVRVTAGQRTGDVTTSLREATAPRTSQMLADQGQDFTAAALRTIGENARRATPDVLNNARNRIGGMFDDLAGRNSVVVSQRVADKADDAVRTYDNLTSRSNVAPIIQRTAERIQQARQSGSPLTGQQYQQIRSDLSKATTSSDGALRTASRELIEALDDGMQETLKASGNLKDMSLYATARRQWRDYLAIERAASSAGTDAAAGIINPRQLRTAVSGQGRGAYARGQRDLGELARAGNIAMTPVKGDSGTASRLGAMASGQNAVPGGLAGYAFSGGDPLSMAAGGAASMLAPMVRNQAVGSRAGQAYLGNQLVPGGVNIFDNPATLGLLPSFMD